jgi:hypothetical protein
MSRNSMYKINWKEHIEAGGQKRLLRRERAPME